MRVIAATHIDLNAGTSRDITADIAAAWWARERRDYREIDQIPDFLITHGTGVEEDFHAIRRDARDTAWSLRLDSTTGFLHVGVRQH